MVGGGIGRDVSATIPSKQELSNSSSKPQTANDSHEKSDITKVEMDERSSTTYID